MVEFAVVAPLLLLLLLLIGELGRAFFQYNTLAKSVRDGARYLAGRAPGTLNVMVLTEGIRNDTVNMVVYGMPSGGNEALLPGLTAADISIDVIDSNILRVVADYQFSPAVVQALPGFGYGEDTPLTFTLTASTTMRML
jgi:Flp pilus assembly protein TadG